MTNFLALQSLGSYGGEGVWIRKLLLAATMNETERGLLLQILDNAVDPDLRLVYADWLEEQGREGEAMAERKEAAYLQHRLEERKRIAADGY